MSALTYEANKWSQQLLTVAEELRGFLDVSTILGLQSRSTLIEDNLEDSEDWVVDKFLPRGLEVQIARMRLLIEGKRPFTICRFATWPQNLPCGAACS